MNVAVRLGIYGLGLTVAFAAALWTGSAVGPAVPVDTAEGHEDGSAPPADDGDSAGDGGPEEVTGMTITEEGYTLSPLETPGEAGEEDELSFRIIGPDGEAVTDFAEEHEKRMHLVVVGRDLSGYQHLHPEMAADGTWSVPVELDTPGPYRMFADFVPEGHGEGLVLGADITVPGDYEPAELPEPAAQAEVDGYEIELEDDLRSGEGGELTFTVRRDGEPVTDLEPYLGAYGHLVVLRGGDLAFLHVHPQEGEAGSEVTFHAEIPSGGDYRLFLDFQHGGQVRTAEFTRSLDGAAGGSTTSDDESSTDHGGH